MRQETIKITEADIKRTVADYLEYAQNQGKLYYDRLNSGDFIEVRGQTRRRIKGCRAGTADFFVLKSTLLWDGVHITRIPSVRVIFLEIKSAKGKLRTEQKCFKTLVESQGAEFYVIRSIEDLQTILEPAQDIPQAKSTPLKDESSIKHRVKRDYTKRRG